MPISENRTKRLLAAGRPAIGTFCFLAEPAIVEMVGLAGFDFVIIDTEHGGKDFATLEAMVRAAELTNLTPLIRISNKAPEAILQILEIGVQGVVIPLLRSGAEAHDVVAALRYPPAGRRGVCRSTRAAGYGSKLGGFATHMRDIEKELLIVGMVEDEVGLNNVDSIVAEGLDVCFVGRADLSANLGVPGELDHPSVTNAVARVAEAAKGAGKAVGNMAYAPTEVDNLIRMEQLFVVVGTDTQFLTTALHSMIAECNQQPHYRSTTGRSATALP